MDDETRPGRSRETIEADADSEWRARAGQPGYQWRSSVVAYDGGTRVYTRASARVDGDYLVVIDKYEAPWVVPTAEVLWWATFDRSMPGLAGP